MNVTVDNYLMNGCGRCPLGNTPACKVHRWTSELIFLRKLVLDCGLTETCKWGVPCYTFQGGNVLLITAFKEYCSINFFKGSLLSDFKSILEKAGPNSQASRLVKFTALDQVLQLERVLKTYIYEAVEVEKAGLKVLFNKEAEAYPEELALIFEEDPTLKAAFEALTPGRQRGYLLYFSAAKQSSTRRSRIEKNVEKILNGKGLQESNL